MLFAGKTRSGVELWPRCWCFIFGGTYRRTAGGYAWTPNILRRVRRFYAEKWYKEPNYTLWRWVSLNNESIINTFMRNKMCERSMFNNDGVE